MLASSLGGGGGGVNLSRLRHCFRRHQMHGSSSEHAGLGVSGDGLDGDGAGADVSAGGGDDACRAQDLARVLGEAGVLLEPRELAFLVAACAAEAARGAGGAPAPAAVDADGAAVQIHALAGYLRALCDGGAGAAPAAPDLEALAGADLEALAGADLDEPDFGVY